MGRSQVVQAVFQELMKRTHYKFPFSVPMIWREPQDNFSDCYFCIVKASGYNRKNTFKIEYLSLPSVEISFSDYGEELSVSNDNDFENKDDFVRIGFD